MAGPVVRIGPNEVDITDIEAVKVIYNHKETFVKSNFYRRLVVRGQESIFSTVDTTYHRRHRRLLAGPMSESSLKTMITAVDDRVRLAVRRMGQETKTRGATDVFKWWLFMATDVIGQLTFGESFQMLDKGEVHIPPHGARASLMAGQKNQYARDLERVGRVGALRSVFPWLANANIPLPLFRQAKEAGQNMKLYATESLDRYRHLVDANPDLAQQTLFTKLFKAEKDDTLPFNEIRDEAVSYIVAGSDTTANTLTFLTWSVSRDAALRKALVDELRTLPADFTESQLRDLPLLNHIIDETLRLYSAAPSSLPRVVPPGGVELAGYWFDEGTTVETQAYSLHRGDAFPDPGAFIPSRWEEPTKAMKDAYMPFGRGSRGKCLIDWAMVGFPHKQDSLTLPSMHWTASRANRAETRNRPFLPSVSGRICIVTGRLLRP